MAEASFRYTSNFFKEEGKPVDIPHPWEYYPKLFQGEKDYFEDIQKQNEFEKFKERRREYAAEHNRRRSFQQNKNNDPET